MVGEQRNGLEPQAARVVTKSILEPFSPLWFSVSVSESLRPGKQETKQKVRDVDA